mmetsp:Transcript_95389/g.139300  ORF Transcript_95389/g.139300 Transcript_95389/m.139300 type:complete len:85 (-) Transcript_95389:36-290(-)
MTHCSFEVVSARAIMARSYAVAMCCCSALLQCAVAVCRCSVLHCVVTSDNYTAATPGMRACAPVCVHACMCVGVRARERVFVRV